MQSACVRVCPLGGRRLTTLVTPFLPSFRPSPPLVLLSPLTMMTLLTSPHLDSQEKKGKLIVRQKKTNKQKQKQGSRAGQGKGNSSHEGLGIVEIDIAAMLNAAAAAPAPASHFGGVLHIRSEAVRRGEGRVE